MSSQQTIQHLFPCSPPISIDGPSRSEKTHHLDKYNELACVSSYNKRCVTVGILPDDVILNIFHFVRLLYANLVGRSSAAGRDVVEWCRSWWYPLIHVCREWRSVIFASPNFLDLKLVCVHNTRMDLIGIWPPLPIIIRNNLRPMPEDYDFDAAIMHRNRVCEIDLRLTSRQLERWPSAMQEPFPALKHLSLQLHWDTFTDRLLPPALPDGFLGGSAPNLQFLELCYIPFPALPKLLLSATDLVRLSLSYASHSGYILPEVFITVLAALVNLQSLTIGFACLEYLPDQDSRRPPLPSRTVLPALTDFTFGGASDFVEVLVARADAPLLDNISMTFFPQPILNTPQLAQFMRRAAGLKALNEARVEFRQCDVKVNFSSSTGTHFRKRSNFAILCGSLELQLSSLAQLFTSFVPSIYMVEHIYIHWRHPSLGFLGPEPQDDTANLRWLETFQSFTSVKNLYVSESLVQGIAHGLEELVEERSMNIFPSLEKVFLEGFKSPGPVQEAVGKFVAARQLLGHPVAVSNWD